MFEDKRFFFFFAVSTNYQKLIEIYSKILVFLFLFNYIKMLFNFNLSAVNNCSSSFLSVVEVFLYPIKT